jgi:transketolase
MQVQTDHGEKLEKEWFSKFDYFKTNYPEEAAEFEVLLSGGLPPNWESCLPVICRLQDTLYTYLETLEGLVYFVSSSFVPIKEFIKFRNDNVA